MPVFSRGSFEPRQAEIVAAEAPLADQPFLPNNVDIVVFYGGHSDRKEFASIAPILEGADVFVPEITAWTIDQLELMSRIAQGDKDARKQLASEHATGGFNPYTAAETKWLLKSGGVRVTPIDYAATHDRADEIVDHFANWQILDKVVPNFGKTLNKIAAYVRTEADLEEHREDIMIRSIGPRLEALMTQDPELRQRERIKVVIQQGTAHTYFFHKLAMLAADNDTVTVRRVFDKPKPILFDHFDRLARSYRAGIELAPEETQELAMRVLARTALRLDAIRWVFKDSDYRNGRRIMPDPEEMVERFSEDSIKTFHQKVVEAHKRH